MPLRSQPPPRQCAQLGFEAACGTCCRAIADAVERLLPPPALEVDVAVADAKHAPGQPAEQQAGGPGTIRMPPEKIFSLPSSACQVRTTRRNQRANEIRRDALVNAAEQRQSNWRD